MKKIATLMGIGLSTILLTACQSTPQVYNGYAGYQIEDQSDHQATLSYTLAMRTQQGPDQAKLQRACQQVLGNKKNYNLDILSINEIATPQESIQRGQQIGSTRTSFALSQSPQLHSTENYATRDALNTRPATLSVVRYICS